MAVKWIGALLVITACGGMGFQVSGAYRRQEQELEQLVQIFTFLSCELTYRLTPLPELCRLASGQARGMVKSVFVTLSEMLEDRAESDGNQCMTETLRRYPQLSERTRQALFQLGLSLGQFDLEGQIKGLEGTIVFCTRERDRMCSNMAQRLRGYQTLGLCAGAALAILLI